MVAILQNSLGAYCRQLTVHEGEDLRLQGIQNLLVHFLSVMQHLEGANTLIGPLIGLMKQPQQYVVSAHLGKQLSVLEGVDHRLQGIQNLLVHFLSVMNHLEGDNTLMGPLIGLMKQPQQYVVSTLNLGKQLSVQEGVDCRLQGIQNLLVHFLSVMHYLEGDNTLMGPLIGLMKQPQQYVVSTLNLGKQLSVQECKDRRLQGIQNLLVHFLSVMHYLEGDNTLMGPLIGLMKQPQQYVVSTLNLGKQLSVQECKDRRLQGIQNLLVHFLSVMHYLEGDNTLMGPLIGLMKQPQQYVVSRLNLGKQLSVQAGVDRRLQGVQSLLVHFLSVMNHLEGANTLMGPLIGLMKQPQQYVVSTLNLGKQHSVQECIDRRLQGIQNLLVHFLSVMHHLEGANTLMGPLIGLMKQPQQYVVSTLNLGKQLSVQECIDRRLQGIQNLLVHFLSVMHHLEGANTLMGPLIGLMKQPQQYVVSTLNLGKQLSVQEGVDRRLQGIQNLFVHFSSVMHHLEGTNTLLGPLIGLMKQPQQYVVRLVNLG